MISYLLFDLDNTLYPASAGLSQEVSRRITAFVAEYLNVDVAHAVELLRDSIRRFGTTLTWLREEHAMTNVEPYLAAVHPVDVSPWITDEHATFARSVFEDVELPASVLTNGPLEHAQRVLGRLGIAEHFERVFDLRWNDFVGKPATAAYERVLSALGIEASSTLLVDDVLQYLIPFRDMGGNVAHLTTALPEATGVPVIKTLRELASIINPDGSNG